VTTVILACGTLLTHLSAAQERMHTNHEVIELETGLHAWPDRMAALIRETMEDLPEEVDTVLLAIGLCGGSVAGFPMPRRAVIPRVDDCITMLLHKDETRYANLKETGHMYLLDDLKKGLMSVERIKGDLENKYGKRADRIFRMWFDSYRSVDVVDTGVYDCHDAEYLAAAQRNADLLNVPLTFVQGGNILLEKLVAGKWDHQFLVAERGQVLSMEDFL